MDDKMLFRPKDLEPFLEPEECLKFTMFVYHACPPARVKRAKVGRRGKKGDLVTEVYHYDIDQCLEIIEDKIANSKNKPTLKDRWLKFSAALEALKIVRVTDGDLDGLVLEVH